MIIIMVCSVVGLIIVVVVMSLGMAFLDTTPSQHASHIHQNSHHHQNHAPENSSTAQELPPDTEFDTELDPSLLRNSHKHHPPSHNAKQAGSSSSSSSSSTITTTIPRAHFHSAKLQAQFHPTASKEDATAASAAVYQTEVEYAYALQRERRRISKEQQPEQYQWTEQLLKEAGSHFQLPRPRPRSGHQPQEQQPQQQRKLTEAEKDPQSNTETNKTDKVVSWYQTQLQAAQRQKQMEQGAKIVDDPDSEDTYRDQEDEPGDATIEVQDLSDTMGIAIGGIGDSADETELRPELREEQKK